MIELIMRPDIVIWMLAIVAGVTTAVAVVAFLRGYLRDLPRAGTSARDRLLERNPLLGSGGELRWTVSARRARTGALTALVISVAVLVAASWPRTDATATDATR